MTTKEKLKKAIEVLKMYSEKKNYEYFSESCDCDDYCGCNNSSGHYLTIHYDPWQPALDVLKEFDEKD